MIWFWLFCIAAFYAAYIACSVWWNRYEGFWDWYYHEVQKNPRAGDWYYKRKKR
jgi:hypothetical protein